MAEIIISGNFTDPSGAPQAGARIDIVLIRNSGTAFVGMDVSQITGENGEYAFNLSEGIYRVFVSYGNDSRKVIIGVMNLEDGSEPGTLNDYVVFSDPVLATPTVYAEIREWYKGTRKAARDVASQVAGVSDAAQVASAQATQALQAKGVALAASQAATEQAAHTAEDRRAAEAAAESAKSAVATTGLMPDIQTGLSSTTAGQSFSVAQGVGSDTAIITYLNNSGVAQETSYIAGTALAEAARLAADRVDARTQGIKSQKRSKYAYEIIDTAGKAITYCDSAGKWFFPGGAKIDELDIENVSTPQITAETANIGNVAAEISLGIGRNVFSPKKSTRYSYAETDAQGHVLWGTLNDGSKEYLGFPLSQQVGQVKNDFFFIGDSITAFTEATAGAYNDVTRGQKPAVCAQGWPVWAGMLSDGRILKTGLSATGGYRADQILATHVPVAIAAKPKFCVVLAGRNDIVQIASYTYEQSIKAINAIYSELRRSGIIPVCCSMSAQSGNTAAQDVKRYKMNEWIRSYAEKYSLPFVDMHKATTDPATGQWFSGWNYDASHPTAAGAKAMGQALVDAMVNWVSNVSPRMAESNTTPETSTNLIANPLLLNIDGPNEPTAWLIGTAGTSNLTSDSAVKGNVLRVASADGTTPATRSQTIAVTPGDVLEFSLKFKANSGGENNVWVNSAANPFALTGILAGIRRWAATMDTFGTYSQRFTVPAGVTSLNVAISGIDLSIGQIGLHKIIGV